MYTFIANYRIHISIQIQWTYCNRSPPFTLVLHRLGNLQEAFISNVLEGNTANIGPSDERGIRSGSGFGILESGFDANFKRALHDCGEFLVNLFRGP